MQILCDPNSEVLKSSQQQSFHRTDNLKYIRTSVTGSASSYPPGCAGWVGGALTSPTAWKDSTRQTNSSINSWRRRGDESDTESDQGKGAGRSWREKQKSTEDLTSLWKSELVRSKNLNGKSHHWKSKHYIWPQTHKLFPDLRNRSPFNKRGMCELHIF